MSTWLVEVLKDVLIINRIVININNRLITWEANFFQNPPIVVDQVTNIFDNEERLSALITTTEAWQFLRNFQVKLGPPVAIELVSTNDATSKLVDAFSSCKSEELLLIEAWRKLYVWI